MTKGFILFTAGALILVSYLLSLQMDTGRILLVILSMAVMVIGLDLEPIPIARICIEQYMNKQDISVIENSPLSCTNVSEYL